MGEIEQSSQVQDVDAPVVRWWEQQGVVTPTVCHVSPLTGEFVGLGIADPSPLEPDVWLIPAGAHLGDAPIVFPDSAAVWSVEDATWHQVSDYRGRTVYDKDTREASVYEVLGELPESFTLLAPMTDFDVWRGKWVLDVEARDAALISRVRLKKSLLTQCAAGMISTLQYAVDKGIATDAEVAALDAWRTYSVLLSRIEPGPVVTWPDGPDNAALTSWLESKGYEDLPDLPEEAP
jgi:hypothetical protein